MWGVSVKDNTAAWDLTQESFNTCGQVANAPRKRKEFRMHVSVKTLQGQTVSFEVEEEVCCN